ncbi:LIC11661 family lipoprotein [Leptospira sp. GIMC2001]|uniref:LIC11661 family lipoprotein n=1 Tax=Leptospira sp. GIMC2001 TaxID=1513297 RepID=UPI00234AED6B|nr:hypothetical protein [Leptospira sp. GIMC2001]WCL50940.1 hypothetical protein O4O04_09055 [Leptospira sp. GIMC2001]
MSSQFSKIFYSYSRIFLSLTLTLILLFVVLGCTNFSASRSNTAPPILISAVNNGDGTFTIVTRAQNPELLFQGYRLYAGGTVNDSRNPPDLNFGVDCLRGFNQPIIPNLPTEYTISIDPSTNPPGPGIACKFQIALGSGTFVTVRSILLALSLNSASGGGSFSLSGPSNTIILP